MGNPEAAVARTNGGTGAAGPALVYDMVARQVPTASVTPVEAKGVNSVRLDHMSGNTTFAMHLTEIPPGGQKCDHRHLDETMAYMVGGAGFTELRQDDDKDAIRIDWVAGDVVPIPSNAWHRHVNASDEVPARQLSFRTTPLMNRILHGADAYSYARDARVYHQGARLYNRFADEPDFFDVRETVSEVRVRTNFVRQIGDEPLPDEDPGLGEGVAMRYYSLGGQLMLDVSLVGIRGGGFVRPHCPLAEEAFIVLAGKGRTKVWQAGGGMRTVYWEAGDVVSPPLGTWREHTAMAEHDVRLLNVRNIVLSRSFEIGADGDLEPSIPDRLAGVLENPPAG